MWSMIKMEKINKEKREKLKLNITKAGVFGLFALSPTFFLDSIKPKETNNEKIIKNKEGRIIEIRNQNGIFKFNKKNPMDYEVSK